MSIQISRYNPLRPPNWRWQAMSERAAQGVFRMPRSQGDAVFRKLGGYLKKRAAGDSIEKLQQYEPHMFWTMYLHEAEDPEFAPLRDELEARVLANETPEQIAKRINLHPKTIMHYEDIFFDIRSRLKYTSYILHYVIGNIHASLGAKNYRMLWRLFAYYSGPHVLNMLVDTFTTGLRPNSPDELQAYTRDTIVNDFMRHALIAGKTFNINTFSQADIMEFFGRQTLMEKQSDNTNQGRDALLKNIEHVINGLSNTWVIGDAKMDGDSRLQYDKQAVGGRNEELLAMAAGEAPESFTAIAGQLEYPPKRIQQMAIDQ